MDDTKVIVDIDRYEQLVTAEANFDMLVRMALAGASLNYRKDELDFDTSDIRLILKGAAYWMYNSRLEELLKPYETTTDSGE